MKKWLHPKMINILLANTNSTGFFVKSSVIQDLKTNVQLDTDVYTKPIWLYQKTAILQKQGNVLRFLKKYGMKN